jgi:HK97 family phage portal protein
MIDIVKRAALQTRMSISDLDSVMDSMYGGTPTYTGKLVSQQSALRVSAVWAAISVRADDFAKLPLLTYYRMEEGRKLARNHYLWGLLQYEANPRMSAFRFKHLMQTWLDLWGNAYAEIETNGRGQVTALWPWRPDRVRVFSSPDGQHVYYEYTMQDRTRVTLPADRILHVRGLGVDGFLGLSPIEQHKQTIGLSMAITEHGARFFSNGARPLGFLQYPGKLGDKAYESLKKDFEARHQGLDNAHRLAILEEGMTYKESGTSMVDAQYLDTMKFTIESHWIVRPIHEQQYRASRP